MRTGRILLFAGCFGLVACSGSSSPQADSGLADDWWQDDDSSPEQQGDEEEDDGGEEDDEGDGRESGFFGYFFEAESGWAGGVETFSEGCLWEVELTGVSVDSCETCSVGIAFVTSTPVVGASDCEEDLSPESWTDASHTVGFDADSAYVLDEGDWVPFADSFFEGDFLGWFLELE